VFRVCKPFAALAAAKWGKMVQFGNRPEKMNFSENLQIAGKISASQSHFLFYKRDFG
jgi:hypothetical protein